MIRTCGRCQQTFVCTGRVSERHDATKPCLKECNCPKCDAPKERSWKQYIKETTCWKGIENPYMISKPVSNTKSNIKFPMINTLDEEI